MTTKSGAQMDLKREEFRKYLEKEGILETLTKSLVALYEVPEKPSDALSYLRNNFVGQNVKELEDTNETLKAQNAELLKQVEQLKKEKAELEDKNKELIQKLASKEASAVEAVAKPASPAKTPDVVAPITEEATTVSEAAEAKEDDVPMEVEATGPVEAKDAELKDNAQTADKPEEKAAETTVSETAEQSAAEPAAEPTTAESATE